MVEHPEMYIYKLQLCNNGFINVKLLKIVAIKKANSLSYLLISHSFPISIKHNTSFVYGSIQDILHSIKC